MDADGSKRISVHGSGRNCAYWIRSPSWLACGTDSPQWMEGRNVPSRTPQDGKAGPPFPTRRCTLCEDSERNSGGLRNSAVSISRPVWHGRCEVVTSLPRSARPPELCRFTCMRAFPETPADCTMLPFYHSPLLCSTCLAASRQFIRAPSCVAFYQILTQPQK